LSPLRTKPGRENIALYPLPAASWQRFFLPVLTVKNIPPKKLGGNYGTEEDIGNLQRRKENLLGFCAKWAHLFYGWQNSYLPAEDVWARCTWGAKTLIYNLERTGTIKSSLEILGK